MLRRTATTRNAGRRPQPPAGDETELAQPVVIDIRRLPTCGRPSPRRADRHRAHTRTTSNRRISSGATAADAETAATIGDVRSATGDVGGSLVHAVPPPTARWRPSRSTRRWRSRGRRADGREPPTSSSMLQTAVGAGEITHFDPAGATDGTSRAKVRPEGGGCHLRWRRRRRIGITGVAPRRTAPSPSRRRLPPAPPIRRRRRSTGSCWATPRVRGSAHLARVHTRRALARASR